MIDLLSDLSTVVPVDVSVIRIISTRMVEIAYWNMSSDWARSQYLMFVLDFFTYEMRYCLNVKIFNLLCLQKKISSLCLKGSELLVVFDKNGVHAYSITPFEIGLEKKKNLGNFWLSF